MATMLLSADAYTLREKLCRDMRAHLVSEEGAPIVLLVPGQLTLEAELLALDVAGKPGSFRLHVLSPLRLCTKILSEAGGGLGESIDENGRVLLMRRAIDQLSTPLRAFERARKRPGFAALSEKAVWQWKEAGASVQDVEMLSKEHAGTPLGDKLADIAVLYSAWEATAKGLGVDSEDLRRLAMERVEEAPFFAGAKVWVYGFDLLTNPIAQCVCGLARVCSEVQALVPMQETSRDARLYAPIRRTYERLIASLEAEGLPYSQRELAPVVRENGAVGHLQRELYSYPVQPWEGDSAQIHLYEARNPRDEAEHIAAVVRQMVRKRNLRYCDIAIACTDSQAMTALQRVFSLYKMPIFFPESRKAAAHPLCASLICAMHIAAGQVTEQDVHSLLALGYTALSDEEADTLRLMAIPRGIAGRKWLRPYLPGDDETGENERFERLRSACFAPIIRLAEGLSRGNTNKRLEAVFTYLTETGAYAKGAASAQALMDSGEMIHAAEVSQSWTKINDCLDRIAALYAGSRKPITAKTLCELLEQALQTVELKPLPQSADAVVAGSLEHIKIRPVKLLVLAGVTDSEEGSVPSILSDDECERLEKDYWLGPNRAERARMRMLAAKSTVQFAEEYVVVSWHVASPEGSVKRPGALVRNIRGIFPDVPVQGGIELSQKEAAIRLLQPDAALTRAGEALRREEGPTSLEEDALRTLATMPEYRGKLAGLTKALQGDRLEPSIPAAMARKLYDGPTELSVTRLEQFARCPFAHFCRYGARPEEIVEYGVTPVESGRFVHAALEEFTQGVSREVPESMDVESAVARMDEITARLLGKQLADVVKDGAVNAKEIADIRAVARRAAVTSLKHMGVSAFSPVAAESAFSGEHAILLDGAALTGFIDRIDIWKSENGQYLRVVDYKRNGKDLSFSQLYYGLQLQLIIYLVAAGAVYDAEYAAALYFNVSDPLVETDERDSALVEAAREKELRLDGLVLSDPEVMRALSNPPEMTMPLRINADGTPQKSSKLLSPADFALLAKNALARAQEDLAAIRAGDIAASPVAIDTYTPCTYCPYKAVCRHDSQSGEARVRRMPHLTAAEALSAMEADSLARLQGKNAPSE